MRKQRWLGVSAALVSMMLVLAACGAGTSPSPSAADSVAASAASVAPSVTPINFTACEVTDTGGVDDKGFNQNAHDGLLRAQKELGIKISLLESTADTDYAPNINTFISQGCDLIVTVGFLLGDATKAAATANPNQKFAIVDYAYDPAIPNVLGLVFDTKSASMLQGYLAAGMSATGTVATFGGIQIGPVTDFMDGYVAGVNYYNKQKGKSVKVLCWDPATATGTFTGDFTDQTKGRTTAEAELQAGADVIYAVAGPVGQGAMAAVKDAGNAYIIGVDVDQYISVPGYETIMLSSELKRIDNAVFEAIKEAIAGSFPSNLYVGTLANDGV
ncbi:MAG: BMP family ABC transporter substrate-binding protein, partial [Candidatus Limnocylindria bacterium]